jgi:undecaprenyl-diphosphatase
MRFADPLETLALVVLFAVLAAPVLYRFGGRPDLWSGPVRRTVWVGALCGSVLLVAQALVVDQVADTGGPPAGTGEAGGPDGAGGPTAADQAALSWSVAHRVGWAVGLSRVLALVGGPGAMAVVAAICVLVLGRRGPRSWAVVVAATGFGAVLLTRGFKQLYARTRPPPDLQVIQYVTHALPSGHALGSTVVAGVVAAVVLLRPGAGRRARVLAPALAAAFVLAVGASRIYLGAHWLTDVLAGILLGGAWLAVGVTALVLLRRTSPGHGAASVTGTRARL